MDHERGNIIREGKAKVLYETVPSGKEIIQYFKDDATAFNAQKKGTILRKGIINNAISCWIFEYLKKKGIPTHYVKKISEREMLVKKVEIIPVETVVRNRATGGIIKRLGLKRGEIFDPPLVEYFLKSDELGDPLISEGHIRYFDWASDKEMKIIEKMARKVNTLLKPIFAKTGLELIDFKLEFGRLRGKVVLADEFTPDGSRLWDMQTGESMDKDRFRMDLGRVNETYQEVYGRVKKVLEN